MISVNYKYSALALALITLKSHSAATLVPEMSQLNVGTAGAGSAILSEGASTAYSNPAAMSYLEDVHIAINMAMMALSIEYQDHRHPSLSSDNAGGAQPYGSVYAVAPISERSRIGLAIVATGGSGLDYGNDYAGRLSVNDLQLSVMQINPSLSYKISEKFSLGAGVQMDRATFEQRFLSQTASIESVSYALGYNLGATYLLSPEHRFGVTFRSKMEHELTGDLTIFNRQIDSRVGLVNAAKLEFSAYHQVNEPIAIVWSFGQEFWSVNEQTSIHLNETEISKARGFEDTWFASLGAKFALSPKMALDMGVGYVSSPFDDPTLQSPDLPVDKQVRYSLGGRYQWSKSTNINMYYSYVDYGSPEINRGAMQGRYDNDNHFVGVELDYRF